MTAQTQTILPSAGFGHQLKADAKALGACKTSIQQALMDISQIDNPDVLRAIQRPFQNVSISPFV
jgi:hypothetical protein